MAVVWASSWWTWVAGGRQAAVAARAEQRSADEADDARRRLLAQIELLDKRQAHMAGKVSLLETAAVEAVRAKRMAEAKAILGRKAALNAQLKQTEATRDNLERQMGALDSARLGAETVAVMRTATQAMRGLKLDVGDVEDTLEEADDTMAEAEAVGAALARPLGTTVDVTDELEELASLALDEQLLPTTTAAPATKTTASVAAADRPTPAQAVVVAAPPPVDDDAELRKLEAAMS